MATVTAAKPRVAGVIYIAPKGTTLPTDADTALGSSFTSLGYLSEDGFSNNYEISSEDIREMGGNIVLTVQTEVSDTFTFKLISALDVNVQKAVYGENNVSGTLSSGMTVKVDGSEPDENVWILETIMRDNALKRIVIPDGKISSIGEIAYRRNEAVGYEITLTALLDATAGFNHQEYTKAATTSTPSTND